jgi:murein DD-endopeptidase MepM/ murein hydrolase activator NlpD
MKRMKMSAIVGASSWILVAAGLVLAVVDGIAADVMPRPDGGAAPRPAATAAIPAAGKIADLRIKLPFSEGTTCEVFQGHGGAFSHTRLNHYAWDFGLPEGSPVCAAAPGRVVRVKQDSDEGGLEPRHLNMGNVIIIDHGRGLFTQYLHLQKQSSCVVEGQMVAGGQMIARSGNTGYSSVPHLHFQVQDASGQSLPAAFLDVPGDGIPRQGDRVTSANDGRGVSPYDGESLMPAAIFARNRVTITKTDLPAHLLRTDREYRVEGRLSRRGRRVAMFVMAADGGKPLLTRFVTVRHDGTFAATLKFDALPARVKAWSTDPAQSNSFAFAVTPVESDGSYWSSYSVPVTVR